jgi:hypothetical protein
MVIKHATAGQFAGLVMIIMTLVINILSFLLGDAPVLATGKPVGSISMKLRY